MTSNVTEVYKHIVTELNQVNLAYHHLNPIYQPLPSKLFAAITSFTRIGTTWWLLIVCQVGPNKQESIKTPLLLILPAYGKPFVSYLQHSVSLQKFRAMVILNSLLWKPRTSSSNRKFDIVFLQVTFSRQTVEQS